MNGFQAITRTIIMLGTLAVGTMAWKVYGPPPEQLAPIVNLLVELASQTEGRQAAEPVLPELTPLRPRAIGIESAIPLPAGTTLRVDSDVVPAEHVSPAPQAGQEDLLAPLQALGAVQVELKPWGAAGQVFRCQCRAISPMNPLLERHFDAIHTDPQTAVERVLVELQSWRRELAE